MPHFVGRHLQRTLIRVQQGLPVQTGQLSAFRVTLQDLQARQDLRELAVNGPDVGMSFEACAGRASRPRPCILTQPPPGMQTQLPGGSR